MDIAQTQMSVSKRYLHVMTMLTATTLMEASFAFAFLAILGMELIAKVSL